ncbi:MAG: sensor histidine kinase [Thalassotalea sp.]|nr:sensor histidine kinase [Thalassotalea sp.]
MSRQLFWKLCLIFATGVVALFYCINQLTSRTEEGMSMLADEHRQAIIQWGKEAEMLYKTGKLEALSAFVDELKVQENTWVSVISFDYQGVVGDQLSDVYSGEPMFGRSVDWKIHLYLNYNPVMEVPFDGIRASFLVQLPVRMRPGAYWRYAHIGMQIVVPTILLSLLAYLLYRYIMKPLMQLQSATRTFRDGDLAVRAQVLMGNRNDEFSDLAKTFDEMAARIGEQIISQRQLIADLSHELRTPLTRLDIALASVEDNNNTPEITRIERESAHIRRLVEDTLSLAWLDNEKPELKQESLDVIDLLEVLIEDARYEFPGRVINVEFPDSLCIENSSHRAAGQAIENILRNALRYTPEGKTVSVSVTTKHNLVEIEVVDQGPGVPENMLTDIFKPFFRVDKSRERNGNSFGLGLALAQRQLRTIGGTARAQNAPEGGLVMSISLPIDN